MTHVASDGEEDPRDVAHQASHAVGFLAEEAYEMVRLQDQSEGDLH